MSLDGDAQHGDESEELKLMVVDERLKRGWPTL